MEEACSKMKSAYQPLVGKLLFVRPRHECTNDIKINTVQE
jgi:hypothetical protein